MSVFVFDVFCLSVAYMKEKYVGLYVDIILLSAGLFYLLSSLACLKWIMHKKSKKVLIKLQYCAKKFVPLYCPF